MTTHVMNCRNGALTNYDAYDFNSYVDAGNGVVLAAGMDGIYELSGDDDNGQVIDAHIRTGNHDFDSSAIKTIIDAYIGIAGEGEFLLSVITDKNVTNTYTVDSLAIQGHTSKVNIGKGAKGRYWTVEFKNVNGADFELDGMEFNVQLTPRRAYAALR
ncbi:MAG: hypothetical protein SFH39_00745 [Candidatus Magnetobacterium sp. LHC-1]